MRRVSHAASRFAVLFIVCSAGQAQAQPTSDQRPPTGDQPVSGPEAPQAPASEPTQLTTEQPPAPIPEAPTAEAAPTPPPTPTPVTQAPADITFHGFAQGNYAVRVVDAECPVGFDCSVMRADERLQLKLDLASSDGRVGAFGRIDFVYDTLRREAATDIRELSTNVDLRWISLRVGRQVVTWGLGDLVFINDVFPKDFVSFLTGAPLEYLKLASDGIRVGLYPGFVNAEVIVIPVFQPDKVPSGSPLFYFDPTASVTARAVELPPVNYRNMQVAARMYRSVGRYELALYFSRGFYGSPAGRPDDPAAPTQLVFFYPRLATYGASLQGPLLDGVLSLEGGYYDSVNDRSGVNPAIENSQARGLAAYQLQPWEDASLSVQYYVEAMMKHAAYVRTFPPGFPQRDDFRHLVSVRFRQMMLHQTLQLGLFALGSPSDEDVYVNPSVRYHVADELWAEVGGNVFWGQRRSTFFGQFEDNSHVYATIRYGF